MSMKNFNKNSELVGRIKDLRINAIKKKLRYTEAKLNKPVSFWIKNDRLLRKKGKEFTIILKTKGCSWALGDYGGCSMCGYVQDSTIEKIDQSHIINQIDYAFQEKIDEIRNDVDDYVIKIFNSGSFFDDDEISEDARKYIFKKIANIPNINEIVIESRVEFITSEKLKRMKAILNGKYVEVAIGLETVNDYIRNNYINKGLKFEDFLKAIQLCKKQEVGVRTYLLFKPPFLNEQTAIEDCVNSIQKLVELEVNTISINPVNIQKGSLVEYLYYQKRYRPPWFYSLFKCLIKAYKENDGLNSVRIISSPSGAGTKKGIHNCLNRECNELMSNKLEEFVLTQDVNCLIKKNSEISCNCLLKYQLQKNFT
ncbi:MAG: archaeosine biosynthesis radical SAM protein RaSEA [Candidatus Hermodarchaeota archaeon]